MLDVVWLILSWRGEPKERKPQANQLSLNWSSQGGQESEAKWNWALWGAVIESVLNCNSSFEERFLYCLHGYFNRSVKLSKAYNWTTLKVLIFTCVIKRSHSPCWTDNCFVRSSPANREFLKAIVGIKKISMLFRHTCIFPKECTKVTTKEKFHRDLIGQCTNEWNY